MGRGARQNQLAVDRLDLLDALRIINPKAAVTPPMTLIF